MQYWQQGTAGKEAEKRRKFSHKQYPLFKMDKRACAAFCTGVLNFYTFRTSLSSFFIKIDGCAPVCPELKNSFFTMFRYLVRLYRGKSTEGRFLIHVLSSHITAYSEAFAADYAYKKG
jgi:hypothetical protein